jgi:hypothetical protein|tara:strand:- start:1495 stop:1716 length:222 start_codon:yes stop_codon:yes gene_type:complete
MNSPTTNIKNQVTRNEQAFLNYHKKMTDIPEPFFLKKFRKEAWTKMEKMLWSDLDREDWRYTKYDVFFRRPLS